MDPGGLLADCGDCVPGRHAHLPDRRGAVLRGLSLLAPAEALTGAGERANKELAERKHIAVILSGQHGYESLSEEDRKALAQQIRDELEVQLHLASADARDEWAALEKKLDHLRGRMEVVGQATEEAAENVGDALKLLGNELKQGYERIRNLL